MRTSVQDQTGISALGSPPSQQPRSTNLSVFLLLYSVLILPPMLLCFSKTLGIIFKAPKEDTIKLFCHYQIKIIYVRQVCACFCFLFLFLFTKHSLKSNLRLPLSKMMFSDTVSCGIRAKCQIKGV